MDKGRRGHEFQIGLTMSGAISAGAYTAGVLDFLIEALDAWEDARNGPDADTVPGHRVGIKVMSGASAGAITAAIGNRARRRGAGRQTKSSGGVWRKTAPKVSPTWSKLIRQTVADGVQLRRSSPFSFRLPSPTPPPAPAKTLKLAGNRENAQSLRVPAIRFQLHREILCRAWKIVAPTPIHMMAVPVQLAEMEIGWVFKERGALLSVGR
jgi:predicted acylesterase/phospholipase RssA